MSYSLNGTTVIPYTQGGKAVKVKGYQIISAGRNGGETNPSKPRGFGTADPVNNPPWKPTAGLWTPGAGDWADATNSNGGDDISNFNEGLLNAQK